MPTERATLEWLANGETGTSSKTMAFWLAFGIRKRDGHQPYDPADLDRCLRLLQEVPALREKLPSMRHLSPQWAALVARWDEVEACHLAEVGLGWTKARSAPKTYALMRAIEEGAHQPGADA
jgi:hypothetical protein